MLCARHMPIPSKDWQRVEGQPIPNGVHRERCNLLVIEGIHKDTQLCIQPEGHVS